MLKMKSTMKQRYILDVLIQLLKNGLRSSKRFEPQTTQQKYCVVKIYMVILKDAKITLQYKMVDSGRSSWENKS